MKRLPQARSADIVQQELNGEVLIYDLQSNTAYNLNETSSIVYRACDGETTFDELKSKYNFTDEVIFFALDQLNAKNLLDDYSSDNFEGMSRRDIIRVIGIGSMVTLPVIASVVAPTAANAASGGLLPLQASCSSPGQCASNSCSAANSTCCSRTSGGSADGAPCSSAGDCCLAGSGCRPNGTCCRGPGRGAGTSLDPQPALCCSGTCNNSGSLCVCT